MKEALERERVEMEQRKIEVREGGREGGRGREEV